jgi:hypothetical protein
MTRLIRTQYDPDATCSESDVDRLASSSQKFDGPSDSEEHTPAQKSKRQKFSPVPSRQYMADPSESDDYDRL